MPKKDIYLHVGFHKTGTTYLQRTFADNREVLQDNGIYYYQDPGYEDRGYDNHALALSLLQEPHPTIDFKEPAQDVWSRFLNTIHGVEQRTVVVSSEVFMEGVDKETIKTRLVSHNVKIIIYIREPSRWFESMYAERLKHGYDKNAETWFEEEKDRSLDFYAEVQSWAKLFGKDNITVRDYDRTDRNKNLLFDFFSIIGLEPSLATQLTLPTENLNHRIPQHLAELLFIYNQLPLSNAEKFAFRNQILSLADQKPEVAALPKFTVNDKLKKKVRKRCTRSYKKALSYSPDVRKHPPT